MCILHAILILGSFFSLGGLRWSPKVTKILPVPPQPTITLPFFFYKILPHFSLTFDFFLAQTCFRKLYFLHLKYKYQNLLQIILLGGIFGLSRQFLQHPSPPPLTPSLMLIPPPHLIPSLMGDQNNSQKQVPHTQNFVKKNPDTCAILRSISDRPCRLLELTKIFKKSYRDNCHTCPTWCCTITLAYL